MKEIIFHNKKDREIKGEDKKNVKVIILEMKKFLQLKYEWCHDHI